MTLKEAIEEIYEIYGIFALGDILRLKEELCLPQETVDAITEYKNKKNQEAQEEIFGYRDGTISIPENVSVFHI